MFVVTITSATRPDPEPFVIGPFETAEEAWVIAKRTKPAEGATISVRIAWPPVYLTEEEQAEVERLCANARATAESQYRLGTGEPFSTDR